MPRMNITSGELLFQCNSEPNGFVSGMNPKLVEFLKPSCLSKLRRNYDEYRNQLKVLRANALKQRQDRKLMLEMDKKLVKLKIEQLINQLTGKVEETGGMSMVQTCLLKSLEKRIGALLIEYGKVVRNEHEAMKVAWGNMDRQYELAMQMERATYTLNSFGLHLVYEGRKRIRLHDLPVDHAQFRRCRKAAVQNIRSDFFKTAGIQGIAVNKVYKIENEFLLENFQEQTVAHPNGKVKGLFCNVDRKAIETMVVNGMHSELLHGAILEPNWFTIPNTDFKEKLHRQQDATFAKTRLQQSAPIAFPKQFSRYSTISDHEPHQDQVSKIWFLALCRVLVVKVNVVSTEEEISKDDTYDAVYSTQTEEYTLKHPPFILPEFIVQYQYEEACSATSESPRQGESSMEENLNVPNACIDAACNMNNILHQLAPSPTIVPMVAPNKAPTENRGTILDIIRKNRASQNAANLFSTISGHTCKEIREIAAEKKNVVHRLITESFPAYWRDMALLTLAEVGGNTMHSTSILSNDRTINDHEERPESFATRPKNPPPENNKTKSSERKKSTSKKITRRKSLRR